MQPKIVYCTRCGGMEVGWNRRYMTHWLRCKRWLRKSSTLLAALILVALILGFPQPSASSSSVPTMARSVKVLPKVEPVSAEILSMNAFLKLHKVGETNRSRLADAIVASARKHDLNPKLLASIVIVESRGNPFAISGQDAVGIMQIHLPTWGETAIRENVNLLKIEDNIDFGAEILKDYVRRFGLWEGIQRYNGFIPGEPAWEESSQRYLAKVQQIYGIEQPAPLQASLLK
jgi:soluble lytic murein transglycosylase-like protein